MGKLHREHAGGFQEQLQPGDEVVDVRHMREDVIPDQQVGLTAIGHNLPSGGGSYEAVDAFDSVVPPGGVSGRHGRLDSEYRNIALLEPAQEIAVVAGNFDHLMRRAKAETLDHLLAVT